MLSRVWSPLVAHGRNIRCGSRLLSDMVRIVDPEEGYETPRTPISVTRDVGGHKLVLERGPVGPFAESVIVARHGDASVVVSVVSCPEESSELLPLQVEYREKSFAAGVIPTTFTRREMTVLDREVLAGRLVDRTIRPLFPKGHVHETQLVASVTSVDAEIPVEPLAVLGASSALWTSRIPWGGPAAAVPVGWIPGRGAVVYPTEAEREESLLSLVYAGTRSQTLMLEVGAKELSEADVVVAFEAAQKALVTLVEAQEELGELLGCGPKWRGVEVPEEISRRAFEVAVPVAEELYGQGLRLKTERARAQAKVKEAVRRMLESEGVTGMTAVIAAEDAVDGALRELVLRRAVPAKETVFLAPAIRDGLRPLQVQPRGRPDGRGANEIRPVRAEVGTLPVVHGSALFSRGQTQVLCTTTLGPPQIAQMQRSAGGVDTNTAKTFFLHYEFPPYSVNETGTVGGANRRAVGHGALAEKAIEPVMPQDFPYTVRATSTVTGSDGSSSMATVCGAALALLDAGVPLSRPVAGVSVGSVSKDDQFALLVDILGLEDHFGDMDFKVAGTDRGITAIQLDMKQPGMPLSILTAALWKARDARLAILSAMPSARREGLKASAPRMDLVPLPFHRRSAFIGPGGAMLKRLERDSGASLRVLEDDDFVQIYAPNEQSLALARSMVVDAAAGKLPSLAAGPLPVGTAALVPPPTSSSSTTTTTTTSTSSSSSSNSLPKLRLRVGDMEWVRVDEVRDFGALVVPLSLEDAPAGLLHVTELGPDPKRHTATEEDKGRRDMRDIVRPGQILKARVLDVDLTGRGRFSRADAIRVFGAKQLWNEEQAIRRNPALAKAPQTARSEDTETPKQQEAYFEGGDASSSETPKQNIPSEGTSSQTPKQNIPSEGTSSQTPKPNILSEGVSSSQRPKQPSNAPSNPRPPKSSTSNGSAEADEDWSMLAAFADWGKLTPLDRWTLRSAAASRGVPVLRHSELGRKLERFNASVHPQEALAVDTTAYQRPQARHGGRLADAPPPPPQEEKLRHWMPDPLFLVPPKGPRGFAVAPASFRYLEQDLDPRAWVHKKN